VAGAPASDSSTWSVPALRPPQMGDTSHPQSCGRDATRQRVSRAEALKPLTDVGTICHVRERPDGALAGIVT